MMRMTVDCLMTVILLLLMGYSRVGEAAHEWLGISMFLLFIIHHILNRKWFSGIFKGKYSLLRIIQTVLVVLMFITMIGSAVSGMILSKYVFGFLDLGGASAARKIHMLCGYWNFILISLHFGLHWVMIVKTVSKKLPKDKPGLNRAARIAEVLVAGYGIYALAVRRIHEYLFGITRFAFIDPEEPVVLFLLDYLAIMGLFVFISHYISEGIRKLPKKQTKE